MLSKRTEALKRADFLARQAVSYIDHSIRAWYLLGQEWFDMEGRIDDEVIEGMPETQRTGVLMGFNAAQWASRTNSQPAVRGTINAANHPGNRSLQWYD